MSAGIGTLAANLASAWEDRANREAAVTSVRGYALIKPEEYERSNAAFRTAVTWYRYWTGIGVL